MKNDHSEGPDAATVACEPKRQERSIKLLRDTLSMLCHFVWHRQKRPGEHLWSIPADRDRDFDCILSDAIDELEQLRAAALRSAPAPSGEPRRDKAWIADRTRQVMAEINACSPGTRLVEVPTLFAFGPIERALTEAYEAAPSGEPPNYKSGENTEAPNTICPACVLRDPRIRLCVTHAAPSGEDVRARLDRAITFALKTTPPSQRAVVRAFADAVRERLLRAAPPQADKETR